VGVRTLSYTPPAIRSDPDEIRFTIHASRVSRTPLADFFRILLESSPPHPSDITPHDRRPYRVAGRAMRSLIVGCGRSDLERKVSPAGLLSAAPSRISLMRIDFTRTKKLFEAGVF